LRPLAEPLAVVSATALAILLVASCMRIYPDPDLPDLKVEWQGACPPDATIAVELVPLGEQPKGAFAASAPCADQRMVVADVERAKLRVVGVVHDASGALVTQSFAEIDTRDGNSKRASLFFEDPELGHVALAWTFAVGETCASLAAVNIEVTFLSEEMSSRSILLGFCDEGRLSNGEAVEAGVYSVEVLARGRANEPVAYAPAKAGVVVADRGALTDLGTVQLKPCDASCKQAPGR
jgi:hypothetical protein